MLELHKQGKREAGALNVRAGLGKGWCFKHESWLKGGWYLHLREKDSWEINVRTTGERLWGG